MIITTLLPPRQARPPARHLTALYAIIVLLIDLTALAGGKLTLDADRRAELSQLDVTDVGLLLALDVAHGDGLLDVRGSGLDVELRLPGKGAAA
jgi:hypothetical protein